FIDEAHRSYSSGGSFLANLMTLDPEAIYIALTGTPILNKTEKTKLKFGDYYHKYFYDKSIADGYTLKIKIEPVSTVFEDEVKRNIEIEENTLDILTSARYIGLLAKYIDYDFLNFRKWSDDDTLGGMIVCKYKDQAKQIHEWFEKNSSLKTALVLDDTKDNKEKQNDFRKTDSDPSFKKYDLLIVQYMLTTGYDVKRLKKMYLLRNPDKHTLLQTISRVNRPYMKPLEDETGDKIRYPYGYIMDFAGIEDHFKTTMEAYTKELEMDTNESGEDNISLKDVIIDSEEIYKQVRGKFSKLREMIEIDNKEEFSIQLMRNSKDNILEIKKLLESIKVCYTEFALSGRKDLMEKVDIVLIRFLLREVQNRLQFLRLLEKPVEQIKIDWLSDEEVVNIIFQFIKKQSHVLELSALSEQENEASKKIKNISEEIRKNQNIYSSKMVKLDEELKRILKKLMMSNAEDLGDIDNELADIYNQLKKINAENEKLSEELGNDFGYVKTYQEYVEEYPETDEKNLKEFFKIVKTSIDKIIVANRQIYRKKSIFVATVKENTTIDLLSAGIFDKLDINEEYDRLLNRIYNNIDLYK
ncbi:MAG: hypothetical protein PHW82_16310, partial [Bacteroidales bacterium]|nr:hypothetical protein [Bacteroidales bacterium]